jgi:hypothetical protein
MEKIEHRGPGTLALTFDTGGAAVTLSYDDTPMPAVRPVQPGDRRTNMTYDTAGPHPGPVAASPPPPEPDGDEPIVVINPS